MNDIEKRKLLNKVLENVIAETILRGVGNHLIKASENVKSNPSIAYMSDNLRRKGELVIELVTNEFQ